MQLRTSKVVLLDPRQRLTMVLSSGNLRIYKKLRRLRHQSQHTTFRLQRSNVDLQEMFVLDPVNQSHVFAAKKLCSLGVVFTTLWESLGQHDCHEMLINPHMQFNQHQTPNRAQAVKVKRANFLL